MNIYTLGSKQRRIAMFWYFIGGLFAGSIIGMMVAALLAASSDSSDRVWNNNALQ